MSRPRRAIANTSEDRAARAELVKVVTSSALAESGKLQPAGLQGSGIKDDDEDEDKQKPKAKAAEKGQLVVDEAVNKSLYVPIVKANKERRTITGVVLEPDTIDAHGDIIPPDVILDAAEDFLANINVETTLGLMHKDMGPPLQLVQSFVVSDSDITINNVLVKKGSWVIVVRVLSDKIWQDIKDGKLTGFSIGGSAQVQNLKPEAA